MERNKRNGAVGKQKFSRYIRGKGFRLVDMGSINNYNSNGRAGKARYYKVKNKNGTTIANIHVKSKHVVHWSVE